MAKPATLKTEKQIKDLEKRVLDELAHVSDVTILEKLRLKYLGRKGIVPLALRALKDFSVAQKKAIGPALNQLRAQLERHFSSKKNKLQRSNLDQVVEQETIDVTEPVPKRPWGHLHPTEQMRRKAEDVFKSMGFEVVRGQEIDDEENNFDLLNIPADHPARDMWDTFWLKEKKAQERPLLLRTHTSNMQVRSMRSRKPPLRVVNIGRVYRFEATDKTHENTFNQIEGFIVDETATLADLQGVLRVILETLFERKLKTRMRPTYFPFVEPGVELDMSCNFCSGKGCSVCKQTGWLEIAGAGMIHPTVLKNSGLNPNKYQGFAFGFGWDRITMLTYGINDIRWLLSGDLRFLEQF